MISKKIQVPFILLLISILLTGPLSAQRTKSSLSSGNQRRSEKGLKDNKYFFFFINPAVSNNGIEDEKTLFTEALRRDLIARMLYMKFSFDLSFGEVTRSQALLIDLYRKVLTREIAESRSLLNDSAAEVMESGDYMAKKYMALGYRSLKWAEKVMLMADNLPEKNYSIRLYEYVKAIKNLKMAKRYAVAALLEKRITDDEIKRIIDEEIRQLEQEKKSEATERERNRITSRIKKSINYRTYDGIIPLIEKYIPDKKEKYLAVHRDNYYRTAPGQSIYDAIMNDPGLENIPEYSTYRKEK